MKKFSFFLLILVLTRVGTAYAAPNDGTTLDFQNFFLGSSANSNVNVNQVLALLVGPEGKPGPAGVAGRDGFVGMNGQDGKDGLPGAPGPVGPQGEAGPAGVSVIAVALSVGDTNCANGGSKFIAGDGTNSFACNGAAGAPGAPGAAGAPGAPGAAGLPGAKGDKGDPGSSVVAVADGTVVGNVTVDVDSNCDNGGQAYKDGDGVISYVCNGSGEGGVSQANVPVYGCDSDGADITPISHFERGSINDFLLDGFKISDLDYGCLKIGYKGEIRFAITDPRSKTDTSPPLLKDATYVKGDNFVCKFTVSAEINNLVKTSINSADPADTDPIELVYRLRAPNEPDPATQFVVPEDSLNCWKGTTYIENFRNLSIGSRDLGNFIAIQFAKN